MKKYTTPNTDYTLIIPNEGLLNPISQANQGTMDTDPNTGNSGANAAPRKVF